MLEPRENGVFVGNSAAERALVDDINRGAVKSAYIISGAYGVGKETLAFRFIRHLIKSGIEPLAQPLESLEMPESDPAFRAAKSGATPQLIEIRDEKITVDTVRNMSEGIRLKTDGRRAALVTHAESMNKSAANSLLKTLEEPPTGVCFILLTTNYYAIPNTIKSRCAHVQLKPLSHDEMVTMLRRFGMDEALADVAFGSLGYAKILDEAGGMNFYNTCVEQLKNAEIANDDSILNNFNCFKILLFNLFKKLVSFMSSIDERTTPSERELFEQLGEGLFQMYDDCVNFFSGINTLSLDDRAVLLWLQEKIRQLREKK